ncbi:LysR family transcriptional regulator [Paenibacillus montaniterrae]|uniref:LysR family transcriptional regulator n=1 Tax=Paenibacillus montaniterrae TaxID=429341 RepID=A0A919YPW6_9BACL|nr:LysR family transcriptional regulator [Paenibacillus montaniterrae]GIP14808.1 LysR family transcriptional regulator [Paenibacillus montaniterrae]
MEIRLIKTFDAIVKYGNFQRAAEVLQYSQPTVTFQIKKLEDELGFKLFERGKTISLTNAGRLFHERTRKLLKEYDELNVVLHDYINGDAGFVRIGASEPTASSRLPAILRSFTEKKPNVQVQVRIQTTKELIRMLLEDEIDIAVCNHNDSHIDLTYIPLLKETFVLLLPEDHLLSKQENVSLKELSGETFLLTPGTCYFRMKIEEIISNKIGELQRSPIVVDGITVLKHFVQAGMGISLAPKVMVTDGLRGVVAKPINGLIEGPQLSIMTRKAPKNKITEELIEEIKRYAATYEA